ncbi:hypothetical protein ACVWXM_003579 [Bradyrhizobium sp. GM7.3]
MLLAGSKRIGIFHDGTSKRCVRPGPGAANATGPGDPGHGRGHRGLRDRHRAASAAAALGGADLADRDPVERRALAEGDARLRARHHRRRHLWGRHRDPDPLFDRGRPVGPAGAGGRATRLRRRDQPEPQCSDGHRHHRAAGSDDASFRSHDIGNRSGQRGRGRRNHGIAWSRSWCCPRARCARSAPARQGCSS